MNKKQQRLGIFDSIRTVFTSVANIAVRSVETVEKGFDNVDKALDSTYQLGCTAEKYSLSMHIDASKDCLDKLNGEDGEDNKNCLAESNALLREVLSAGIITDELKAKVEQSAKQSSS